MERKTFRVTDSQFVETSPNQSLFDAAEVRSPEMRCCGEGHTKGDVVLDVSSGKAHLVELCCVAHESS
jgi:hypothetical protein